jgi:NADH-quinone oxidoreductase subunit A
LLFEFSVIFIFLALGAAFVLIALGFGAIVRPRRMRRERNETYECGEKPVGPGWYNFNPRFYMLALIFLIFDVEIVVSYPVFTVLKSWAARGQGWLAFLEILLFVVILVVGLAFLWVRGDLEWIKKIEMTTPNEEMK